MGAGTVLVQHRTMYRNQRSFMQSDDELQLLGLQQPPPVDAVRRERFCMSGSETDLVGLRDAHELSKKGGNGRGRGTYNGTRSGSGSGSGSSGLLAGALQPSGSSSSLLGSHLGLLGLASSSSGLNLRPFNGSEDDLAMRAARYCVDGDDTERGGYQPRTRVSPKRAQERKEAAESDAGLV